MKGGWVAEGEDGREEETEGGRYDEQQTQQTQHLQHMQHMQHMQHLQHLQRTTVVTPRRAKMGR